VSVVPEPLRRFARQVQALVVVPTRRLAVATSSGVRPCLFFAVRLAPLSTRKRTIGSDPRPVIAAWSAVSPVLVVALMSMPACMQSLIASIASCSEPWS